MSIWEFPKIRGTLSGGPYNKDPTIYKGTILGSPIFGNPPYHVFRAYATLNLKPQTIYLIRFEGSRLNVSGFGFVVSHAPGCCLQGSYCKGATPKVRVQNLGLPEQKNTNLLTRTNPDLET